MVKTKTQSKALKRSLRSGRTPTTFDDFKSAALLVSVTINLAVFVGWLAIKLTTEYDSQVASFLFGR